MPYFPPPSSGGVSDGDKGDITVSSSGTAWAVDSKAITYAKIQDISATDKVLGRSTAGSGVMEEIACTAAGRAIIDDADAAAQRTTLGLGTLATQSGTFSGTSSGTNTGDQTLPVKATGAELDTGTDDAKFATAKALQDSHNVPLVAPSTSGNVLTSNGTDWTSAAPTGAPTLVTGNSGAANANAAPSETWQILSSDATTNSTTTLATVMTTTSLPTGTYFFKYYVRYQAGATTTGVKFALDYSGTVTWVLVRHTFSVEATAASSLVPDSAITAGTAGIQTNLEFRADASVAGPTASVDTANADMLWMIEGIMAVSTSANLLLQHASEVAAASTVKSGTCMFLRRLA